MIPVTFLKSWDGYEPGDIRPIDETLADRLYDSGIAKPFKREKTTDQTRSETDALPETVREAPVLPEITYESKLKPKRSKSDKRLKPSQKKGNKS
jgi:hypothetical protein